MGRTLKKLQKVNPRAESRQLRYDDKNDCKRVCVQGFLWQLKKHGGMDVFTGR